MVRPLCGWAALAVIASLFFAVAESSGQVAEGRISDADVEPVVFQPPAEPPATTPATARPARRPARYEYAWLDRAPNMFGDSLAVDSQILVIPANGQRFFGDLPLGSGRSYNVAENNKPLPMDRVYFNYNGFKNAIQSLGGVQGPSQLGDSNIDLYTLGLEKSFFDGGASIDVRMPFASSFDLTTPGLNTNRGNVGDLSMFFKGLLYSDDMVAMAAGVGVGLPTGDDVEFRSFGQTATVNNDAVHVMPFLGAMIVPNEVWFLQTFVEVDFAASGNEVEDGFETFGEYTEQHLFHADFTIGAWIYDNPEAYYVQGVAAVVELHYTSTIHDSDNLAFEGEFFSGAIGNINNRVDPLNLTSGLHFQIGPLSNLRVGAVVPLHSSGENRQFDSEVQVQFNRFF